MKIKEIIIDPNAKDLKKLDIGEVVDSMKKKIEYVDINFTNIKKNEFFIHDLFFISNGSSTYLFLVYKYHNMRVLLQFDDKAQALIIRKVHLKKKNKQKYYLEFRDYARKVVC